MEPFEIIVLVIFFGSALGCYAQGACKPSKDSECQPLIP